ncbi:unnamed protein product [Penicillium olsonii]|nr:unnamed protein product [Penicillium olsonii]
MKGFIGGIPIALLAVAAQAQVAERQNGIGQEGNTVINGPISGPSGKDFDSTFTNPYAANINENHQKHEYTKEDHSVNVKHTKEFHPHSHGPSVVEGPQVPGMGPFAKRQAHGGTAMGGPSGNDGGQSFDLSYTANIKTDVSDTNTDDHSIDLDHTDAYGLPPWKRSFGNGYEGGTAMGGPSGDDEGQSVSLPTTVDVDTSVKDFNKDDHSIDLKHKDAYYGHPWKRGFGPHNGGTAMGGPSGDDGGQSFDLSYTANIKTDVSDTNTDDHSIDLDHKDSYYGPHWKRGFGFEHGGGTAMGGPSGGEKGQHGGNGGTAMGGPSGDDESDGFSLPTTVNVNSAVNDVNKDDHSIDLKHKDAYYGHPWKRGFGPQNGGTAMGGPSGDDEGQSVSLPTTVDVDTSVNDVNKDSHAIDLKHTDVNGPHWGGHGGWGPHGGVDVNAIKQQNNGPAAGAIGPFNRRDTEHWPHPEPGYWGHDEDFDLNAIKQVNNGPSAGAIGPFNRRSTENWPHPHPGYWGPEEDYDVNTINQVNNGPSAGAIGGFARRDAENWPHPQPHPHPHPGFWGHEDHDINTISQVNNGPAAGGIGPFTRRDAENWPHPQPHPHPHPGYWGHEEDFDLNSIKQVNNGPSAGAIGPFGRRAFAPSRESSGGEGTVLGGPSSEDEGTGYSDPTNVQENEDVDENHNDDHSVSEDVTHVHHPDGPWGADASHADAPSPPSEQGSDAPPSFSSKEESTPPREESGECSAQVHEVVRTVTKTQYKTAQATRVVYQSAPSMETSAVPMYNDARQSAPSMQTSAIPMSFTPQQSAEVDPKMMSYAVSAPAPASSGAFESYNYSQRPNSHAASYSMIPVHVPMATPGSSGAAMATPSGTHGLNMPTGVSAEQKAASSSAAASASPSSHGANTMFMGAAPRLSGGLASAATAVIGVLAFIL